MSSYYLAEHYHQCLDRKPTSTGFMRECENMRRECERRAEVLGRLCRDRLD